ncbi:MAG TPA: hypothetical protein VFW70_18265 [Methylomirabilota bacterium]|nr:hypothetical protein [Methylomirabilota bacterium]
MSTTPTARKRKASARPARKRTVARPQERAKIVRLPRRVAERAGCMKCGSLFIEIEPAFVHCRYCGSLSRIRGTSLLAQEEYEMRSGLRLAS